MLWKITEEAYASSVTGFRLQATGYKFQASGYKLQVTGFPPKADPPPAGNLKPET